MELVDLRQASGYKPMTAATCSSGLLACLCRLGK